MAVQQVEDASAKKAKNEQQAVDADA